MNIRILWRLGLCIMRGICYIIGYTLGYSYFNPGKLGTIDSVRVSIQGTIVEWLDNSLIGETYTKGAMEIYSYQDPITRNQLSGLMQLLQPGDIIVTHSNPSITTTNIPGYRKHIALYLGTKDTWGKYVPNSNQYTGDTISWIIDATSEGVTIRPLQHLSDLHIQSTLQNIEILRLNTKQKIIKKIIQSTIENNGKKYDYDLRLDNNNEIYCSELLSNALNENGISITADSKAVARIVITPQNIYDQLLQSKKASIVGKIAQNK